MATYFSGLIIFLLGMIFMYRLIRVRLDYMSELLEESKTLRYEAMAAVYKAQRHINLLQDECKKRSV